MPIDADTPPILEEADVRLFLRRRCSLCRLYSIDTIRWPPGIACHAVQDLCASALQSHPMTDRAVRMILAVPATEIDPKHRILSLACASFVPSDLAPVVQSKA